MYLDRLQIMNYKNLREVDLTFSKSVNCLIGNNGVGKTNLLDAIYYLSFTKSRMVTNDVQNITWEEEMMFIKGLYHPYDHQDDIEIHCGIKKRQSKTLKKNGKEYDRITDHIGLVPLVIVSPADHELIEGGGEERRKFINGVISQYDRVFFQHYMNYVKALAQRNTLLKNGVYDTLQYEMWEERIAAASDYIFKARVDFLEKFVPLFQEFYNFISESNETVSLSYRTNFHEETDFFQLLLDSREKDIQRGFTTVGVHRDDLEMLLSNYPLRRVGSQGQCKTYLIALKLAQYVFLSIIAKKRPILLFDDIFDKLDASRVSKIIDLINNDERFGQIFITDTDRQHISSILRQHVSDYKIFSVDKGVVTEQNQDDYEEE